LQPARDGGSLKTNIFPIIPHANIRRIDLVPAQLGLVLARNTQGRLCPPSEDFIMSILKRFTVTSLWGEKDLALDFHDDVNFLIGRNGSGKTTVINLIAAALSADFPTLDRVDFKKIEMHLSGPHRPVIEVLKKAGRKSPFAGITYRYKPKRDVDWKEFSLDEIESQMVYRDWNRAIHHHRRTPDPIEVLGIKVNVTWLSIHRAGPGRPREDRSFESTIDIKLEQLSNSLTRLFSQFKSKGDEQTARFQKSLFFALLPPEDWRLKADVRSLDLEKERQAFQEIFENFGVPRESYLDKLQAQFERVKDSLEKTSFTDADLTSLCAMWSIHRVVQQWAELRTRQAEINKPRHDFLAVINEMLSRKKLTINERNELKAEMEGHRSIALSDMSSGEKQLLIILGEALLQQQESWIYIADEPELSLHVTWQEKLTENLRQINPAAQIIFATHSPDIVGRFENKVFDMEKLLR
jgi:predicted ATPase